MPFLSSFLSPYFWLAWSCDVYLDAHFLAGFSTCWQGASSSHFACRQTKAQDFFHRVRSRENGNFHRHSSFMKRGRCRTLFRIVSGRRPAGRKSCWWGRRCKFPSGDWWSERCQALGEAWAMRSGYVAWSRATYNNPARHRTRDKWTCLDLWIDWVPRFLNCWAGQSTVYCSCSVRLPSGWSKAFRHL